MKTIQTPERNRNDTQVPIDSEEITPIQRLLNAKGRTWLYYSCNISACSCFIGYPTVSACLLIFRMGQGKCMQDTGLVMLFLHCICL